MIDCLLDARIQKLINFIDESPSMFHTIKSCEDLLISNHFIYLDPCKRWDIQKGGRYYTMSNQSALIAFYVNSVDVEKEGFKIVGTHGDSPGFRIKPNPQMQHENYIKLNTEVYGGPILSTWFDRPLSIAGRVSHKSSDFFHPHHTLVKINRPLLVIPNLALHMNQDVNTGFNINKQKDTLPILTYLEESIDQNLITELISQELQIPSSDILDMDLFLYPFEKGMRVGLHNEFLSAPRLDNLSMTYSALYGFLGGLHRTSEPTHSDSGACDAMLSDYATSVGRGISVFACFDNEEVGSRTKQGADSPFLENTLERILLALGKNREEFFMSLAHSFMLSADVAHLVHPNYPEKSDPTHKVLPGKGPAIKVNSNFSYISDSDSSSVFAAICQAKSVPYQVFVNRSDLKGGSTIGPAIASHLSIRGTDIGTPILSMHSSRELMTITDFIYTCDALKAFFNYF